MVVVSCNAQEEAKRLVVRLASMQPQETKSSHPRSLNLRPAPAYQRRFDISLLFNHCHTALLDGFEVRIANNSAKGHVVLLQLQKYFELK
jgi:hypothetical protein